MPMKLIGFRTDNEKLQIAINKASGAAGLTVASWVRTLIAKELQRLELQRELRTPDDWQDGDEIPEQKR